jgi:hypothetical protein
VDKFNIGGGEFRSPSREGKSGASGFVIIDDSTPYPQKSKVRLAMFRRNWNAPESGFFPCAPQTSSPQNAKAKVKAKKWAAELAGFRY